MSDPFNPRGPNSTRQPFDPRTRLPESRPLATRVIPAAATATRVVDSYALQSASRDVAVPVAPPVLAVAKTPATMTVAQEQSTPAPGPTYRPTADLSTRPASAAFAPTKEDFSLPPTRSMDFERAQGSATPATESSDDTSARLQAEAEAREAVAMAAKAEADARTAVAQAERAKLELELAKEAAARAAAEQRAAEYADEATQARAAAAAALAKRVEQEAKIVYREVVKEAEEVVKEAEAAADVAQEKVVEAVTGKKPMPKVALPLVGAAAGYYLGGVAGALAGAVVGLIANAARAAPNQQVGRYGETFTPSRQTVPGGASRLFYPKVYNNSGANLTRLAAMHNGGR